MRKSEHKRQLITAWIIDAESQQKDILNPKPEHSKPLMSIFWINTGNLPLFFITKVLEIWNLVSILESIEVWSTT